MGHGTSILQSAELSESICEENFRIIGKVLKKILQNFNKTNVLLIGVRSRLYE